MAVAALAAGLSFAPGPSRAGCVAAGADFTCSPAGGVQTTTVGAGSTPDNAAVEVLPGALVDTGNASGISVGNNARIVIRSGATVQNTSTGADSPYGGGIGANTIEVNNNSTVIVEQGANLFANGSFFNSESINPVGSNNTIINNGYIRSSNTAIFFQAPVGQNTVINTGRMEAGYVAGSPNNGTASVLGANGVTGVDFTNRGEVVGSLNFGDLADTLRLYTGSSITGNINGGGGANQLTLNSDNGAAATFAPLSITSFQTLAVNGGAWTFNPQLSVAGVTAAVVPGGTLALGSDNSAYTGNLWVEAPGTLQTSAQFAPRAINNAGLVRFAQPDNATYAGLVSGTGGIEKTGAGVLTIARDQGFSGLTTISGGTLQLGAGGGAGLVAGDILNNATLAINRSDTVRLDGRITGSGAVRQIGAGATVFRADNRYTGGTTIAAGTLQLGDGGSAGSLVGDVANEGVLAVDRADTLRLAGRIGGSGAFRQQGSGRTVLAGSNTYAGATTVAAGTLAAGAAGSFSAASAHTVAASATLDLAGFDQQVAALANAGTVSLPGAGAPGTTLAVSGAYVGNNGVVRLNTALGGDNSATDRLLLSGPAAAASGSTTLAVTNVGGGGALTTGNGIEVVRATGGATTAPGAFTLFGGHVDAGAYEYRLYDGDAAGAGESWYLRSTGPTGITYRAEGAAAGRAADALRTMDLAMLGNLHQRIGDEDAPGGDAAAPRERRAWGRVVSTDLDIRQGGTASPVTDGRVNGFQAGSDLWATARWRAGVYVGQLDGDARVSGFASGIPNLAVGSNDLRGQYLGAYGTWSNGSGFYADAVLQAGRHRYTLEPGLAARSDGKGDSLLASIEIGQAFALSENWQIEPQLQLIHQRLKLDDLAFSGAYVQQDTESGWIGRAGVRIKGRVATGAGLLQPYARFNYYRSSSGIDTARFIGSGGFTDIATPSGRRSTELAAGATLGLNERTSVYGEVGKLWASGGDARVKSSLQASLGLRVRW